MKPQPVATPRKFMLRQQLMTVLMGVLLILICCFGRAQRPAENYLLQAQKIKQNICRYFYDSISMRYQEFYPAGAGAAHKYTYLWPLCGLVQAANEVEALQFSPGYFDEVLQSIEQYYDDRPPRPGYSSYLTDATRDDRFYDDNQWIGIACLDAYQRTKNKKYLQQAKLIYDFMMTGFDTAAGGGLYWKEKDFSTKNTCSNGPGVLVALQLYKITGYKNYLDTAVLLYNWVNKKLRSPDGLYYDNIKVASGKIDLRKFTYNTGTMLQSAVMLFEITHQTEYLTSAQLMASASLKQFFHDGFFPDNYWFNAVLLRGYIALHKINGDEQYINAMRQYAGMIWQKEKDLNGLVGKHKTKRLLDQAAVLEIFASLAKLQKK